MPRRLRLHVFWSGHAIKGAATNTRLGTESAVYGTTPAVMKSGMRLPSALGDGTTTDQ